MRLTDNGQWWPCYLCTHPAPEPTTVGAPAVCELCKAQLAEDAKREARP